MRYRLQLMLSRTMRKGKRMLTLLVDLSMMESICRETQMETDREIEMLKCETARTKTAIGEWTAIFEPYKGGYRHFLLEDLSKM